MTGDSTKRDETLQHTVKDLFTQPLHIPFSNKAAVAPSQGHPVNATRIVEAVIIAVITSLVIYVTSIPKLETKIESQQKQLEEIKTEVSKIRQDFYVPFGRGNPTSSNIQGNKKNG